MSKMELTEKQKSMLKEHAKHHTKKHIKRMTSMMKQGLSFKKAHTKTRAIEKAEAKKRGKKTSSQVKDLRQKQTQRQVINISLGASRRQAKRKPRKERSIRESRVLENPSRMAFSMGTTPATANISMLQADVNFIRNKALELEQSMGRMSQQQAIHNNDRLSSQPQIPVNAMTARLTQQDVGLSPRRTREAVDNEFGKRNVDALESKVAELEEEVQAQAKQRKRQLSTARKQRARAKKAEQDAKEAQDILATIPQVAVAVPPAGMRGDDEDEEEQPQKPPPKSGAGAVPRRNDQDQEPSY